MKKNLLFKTHLHVQTQGSKYTHMQLLQTALFAPGESPYCIAFKFNTLTLTLIPTENLLIQTKGAYYDTAVIETDLCNRHLCLSI